MGRLKKIYERKIRTQPLTVCPEAKGIIRFEGLVDWIFFCRSCSRPAPPDEEGADRNQFPNK
ncbi:unnamed protein product [Amoebophrya sp. A25]|nr:unnamed protein product [Amoebophrya sp. A25]|eukprot:GSA25T00019505001.1